jgi:hypothetical protein
MANNKIAYLLAAISVFMVTACAQQPKIKGTEAFDESFTDRISMVCGYWPADDVGLLGCDIDNRGAKHIELWVIQEAETEDSKVSRETRAYKGYERTIHVQWKLSSVAEKESVVVRLTGIHGTIIKRKLK